MNDYKTSEKTKIGDYTIFTHYYNNGVISEQSYYIDKQLHNTKGPAVIKYYRTGQICKQFYYVNDELHSTTGPAIVMYNKKGCIIEQYYYLNDIYYEDILKYMIMTTDS